MGININFTIYKPKYQPEEGELQILVVIAKNYFSSIQTVFSIT